MIGGYRAFPFLPPSPEGMLDWARSFVATLDSDLFWIDDQINKRITYGVTADKPASTGSGNLYFDTTLDKLEIDLSDGWADAMSPGAIDHGGLTGLGDDDHTQYLLANGTRGLSADWDAGSHAIRAETLESDVVTGTAPLKVASTTVCGNLNVDLLDGYHAADFSAASHNHDADYVDIDGDTMTGDLVLNNSIAVSGKETGGTARDMIQMNASNVMVIGNADNDISIPTDVEITGGYRLAFNPAGYIYALTGAFMQSVIGFDYPTLLIGNGAWNTVLFNGAILPNAEALQGYDAAGTTAYNLALVNASDEVHLGSASLPLNLNGTRVDAIPGLLNAVALKGLEAGGTARDMVVMDASNDVIVGNATTDTKLYGNPITSVSLHRWGGYAGGNYGELETDGDLIQYGTAYAKNLTRIESPEFRGKLWETSLSKTLTNNTALNLWKWAGTADGDALGFHGTLTFELEYSNAGSTYYWSRSYTYVGEILRVGTGTNLMKGVFTATANGAAQHYKSDGGAGVGTVAETLTMATQSTTSLGPTGKIYLSGTGTWVSGRMKYTLQSTDVDHTGFTLFT